MKFIVSGETRYFPDEIWGELEGPLPSLEFECNGCSVSPDYIRQYPIWPACVIHDFHYGSGILGENWAGRREADQILRRNMQTVLKIFNAPKYTQWFWPYIYWGRVRVWGPSHYKYSPEEKPEKLHHRLIEGWGWFKDKRK